MRIRNKNIPIRVTEKELEIIDRKAVKAKLSRTDFLVTAALGKEITLMEDLKPILTELRRIGNNVNQLTKLANTGAVRVVGLQDLTETLGEIHVALMRIALHRKEDAVADSEADQVLESKCSSILREGMSLPVHSRTPSACPLCA